MQIKIPFAAGVLADIVGNVSNKEPTRKARRYQISFGPQCEIKF
jgi:hypothetical protein